MRVDTGAYDGYEVPIHYDPLIAKVITWGSEREEARIRMVRALQEYAVGGIKTTIPFLKKVVESSMFARGDFHTGTLAEMMKELGWEKPPEDELASVVMGALAFHDRMKEKEAAFKQLRGSQEGGNPWKMSGRYARMRKL